MQTIFIFLKNVASTAPTITAALTRHSTTTNNNIAVAQYGSSSQKRLEPTSSQKLDILRTAIATVLKNPAWRTEEALSNQRASIRQFGQYVAVQLGQIEDEEVLLATQQKIMSLLNKAI